MVQNLMTLKAEIIFRGGFFYYEKSKNKHLDWDSRYY